MIQLSILIATMPSRIRSFDSLMLNLKTQAILANQDVEILYDNSVLYNIGTKRNKLLERANGNYIVFCDDDDLVSDNYVKLILEATKSNADCIGINGIITTNGKDERKWFISKEYGCWKTEGDVYLRTPNHISPVKRELALLAMFPEISFGEDYEYSMRLLPLLTSEEKITEPLYFYRYRNDERK